MGFTEPRVIIEALRAQLGLDENISTVIAIWEREMGAQSRHVKLAGFKKGQLIVDVSSTAHMQEISLRRREIINKINQYFGGKKIVTCIKVQLETQAEH
ncbi:MAG: DUF721 domain-containing protein [Endomicrobiales bacterium]|jgi:hypothetical protein